MTVFKSTTSSETCAYTPFWSDDQNNAVRATRNWNNAKPRPFSQTSPLPVSMPYTWIDQGDCASSRGTGDQMSSVRVEIQHVRPVFGYCASEWGKEDSFLQTPYESYESTIAIQSTNTWCESIAQSKKNGIHRLMADFQKPISYRLTVQSISVLHSQLFNIFFQYSPSYLDSLFFQQHQPVFLEASIASNHLLDPRLLIHQTRSSLAFAAGLDHHSLIRIPNSTIFLLSSKEAGLPSRSCSTTS